MDKDAETVLRQVKQLCSDPTPWALADIQQALGLKDPRKVKRLWDRTLNYMGGRWTQWPPPSDPGALPASSDRRPLTWWPAHYLVLPRPDYLDAAGRPRWAAGTIRRWAVTVGRMAVDGTPILRPPGGQDKRINHPALPDASKVDLAFLRNLRADDDRWTINEIRAYFGVSAETAGNWLRGVRNRLITGTRTWPPTKADSRKVARSRRKPTLPEGLWWPAHNLLLPPPCALIDTDDKTSGSRSQGAWAGKQLLWRAGDIKAWGLKLGRVRLDGSVRVLQEPTRRKQSSGT